MSISETNQRRLEFLKDIYEVSTACSTRSYIWGGLTIDIFEGKFLREHGDIDAFTANLLDLLDELIAHYEKRGYRTKFIEEYHMFEIWKDDLHASFNRLETASGVAMWRHIGEHGTVYFPYSWLDDTPRDFYETKVYTSGVEFEYAIKSHVGLLSPVWKPREKDRNAVQYLERVIERDGLSVEEILKNIWSFNPFWVEKGYAEFAMPRIAWPLSPTS